MKHERVLVEFMKIDIERHETGLWTLMQDFIIAGVADVVCKTGTIPDCR